MEQNTKKILLNEILRITDLENVKIRFNLMFRDNWNPVEVYKEGQMDVLLEGHYCNYTKFILMNRRIKIIVIQMGTWKRMIPIDTLEEEI